MQAIKCELCGSNSFTKEDGYFVCNHCNTKYTLEEAKKMMIEGTVNVKVDDSEELNKLYQIARRARDEENNQNAAKYYEMILMKDPSSWEANFYTVYFQAMSCKIGEIPTAATSVNNCISNTFKLIKENVSDVEERKRAISEVYNKAKKVSDMLFNANQSWYRNLDPSIKPKFQSQSFSSAIAAGGIMKTVCDKICDIFYDDDAVLSTIGVKILKNRISQGIAVNAADRYVKVIQKYEPTYQPPQNQSSSDIMKSIQKTNTTTGGCFIATAVYGSYDCPQVWTLRRYRDYNLAESWYGRAFVKTYYAISPTLVKWFGNTKLFKKLFKSKLDHMVEKLNSKGYKDTPYEDKKW